jgi:O-antigen ligase
MFLAFFFLMEYVAKRVAWRVSVLAVSCAVAMLAAGIFFSVLFPYLGVSRSFQSSMEAVGIRMLSIGNSTDESISWRGATWQSAFMELEKHPLFGSGFGAHVAVESGEDYRDFIEVRNIHNSWFAALVQMGIVGMMFLLAALATLIFSVMHIRADTDITAAARLVFLTLIAYQAVVLLAQPYLETNLTGIFFWLTLGSLRMLLVVNRKQEKRRRENIMAVSEKALDI